jgi:molecular chaperone GrpE
MLRQSLRALVRLNVARASPTTVHSASAHHCVVTTQSSSHRWLHASPPLRFADEKTPADTAAVDATATAAAADAEASEKSTADGEDIDLSPPAADDEATKKLVAEVETLTKETAEWKKKYMLQLAETQNVITRLQGEVNKAQKFGVQKIAKELLETGDVLSMALNAVPPQVRKENEEAAKIVEGVEMIEKTFQATLRRHKIEKYESLGKPFDPELHDGVFEMDATAEHPTAGTVGW